MSHPHLSVRLQCLTPTTCRDFNATVNMTAEELQEWLEGDESQKSGWSKEDGSGESIGHDRSGSLP